MVNHEVALLLRHCDWLFHRLYKLVDNSISRWCGYISLHCAVAAVSEQDLAVNCSTAQNEQQKKLHWPKIYL